MQVPSFMISHLCELYKQISQINKEKLQTY